LDFSGKEELRKSYEDRLKVLRQGYFFVTEVDGVLYACATNRPLIAEVLRVPSEGVKLAWSDEIAREVWAYMQVGNPDATTEELDRVTASFGRLVNSGKMVAVRVNGQVRVYAPESEQGDIVKKTSVPPRKSS
jgi:hypothetical protein